MERNNKAVVAGHICIDITPSIPDQGSRKIEDIFSPGRLVHAGDVDIHTGGAVSNTGLAMKFFGADVTLAGKIGDDALGEIVTSIMKNQGAEDGLIIKEGESTSYSVVLAVPGVDRIFIHNPGANDTFSSADLPLEKLKEAALFHFGYPSIIRSMYTDGGKELVRVLALAKQAGCAVSLDLAMVDPNSEAGRTDWKTILTDALPYVDFFVPSAEELLFMLEPEKYFRIRAEHEGDLTEALRLQDDIIPLADKCLSMGAKIVLIKCGAPGLYYCTKDAEALDGISKRLTLDSAAWGGKKGFEKSFKPDRIVSGTGAGDTCIAAFLTAMLDGYPPETCIRYAAAAGACCVQAYDALSGLLPFSSLDEKFSAGWDKTDEIMK